jgi:hypothetical protein
VLNLRERVEGKVAERTEPAHEPVRKQNKGTRKSLRVPWQRRPRRQPQPVPETEVASAG